MKRTERHHLKENELAQKLSAARDFVDTQRRLITTLAIAVGVIGLVVVAFTIYRGQVAARGDELLADAMVALNAPVVPAGAQGAEGLPAAAQIGAANTFATEEAKLNVAVPKLKATADAYPDTPAGITARYHLGAALASLGRHDEALQVFDEVVKRAGADTLYGRMATMGKADTQASSGQLDSAIATWKDLTTKGAEDLPVDAILMELARAYLQKGDTAEARKTFSLIVDQHADSPYSAEARRELESLKG
jgi:predicted negative regulator of RcsB-dependent stress response